jgi:PKD repeat protein
VQFNGEGRDDDGAVASYYWEFGDGSTSEEQNPLYTYNEGGTYTVTLTVTDNDGLKGLDEITITALKPRAVLARKIRFQAKLKDSSGADIDEPQGVTLTFRIYNQETDGTPLWSETQEDVAVKNGVLDVLLGSAKEIGLPFDEQYYLSVEVNEDGEMSPRFVMTMVPYAFRSER